jgi:hypothetical protein
MTQVDLDQRQPVLTQLIQPFVLVMLIKNLERDNIHVFSGTPVRADNHIELCYESCRNSPFSLSESNI